MNLLICNLLVITMLVYRRSSENRGRCHATGPSSPPVTSPKPASTTWLSKVMTTTTALAVLAGTKCHLYTFTIVTTPTQISSAHRLCPLIWNYRSMHPLFYQEEEISFSQIPPWSFSQSKSNSSWSNVYEGPCSSCSQPQRFEQLHHQPPFVKHSYLFPFAWISPSWVYLNHLLWVPYLFCASPWIYLVP